MGNKNSSAGIFKEGDSDPVKDQERRNSRKTFKPLKARSSVTDQFALKLHSEEVVLFYEAAQSDLKSKIKKVYSQQDKINEQLGVVRASANKFCSEEQKVLDKTNASVVELRNSSTDLKTMIDSIAVDVKSLFDRAEEIDRALAFLETKVDL